MQSLSFFQEVARFIGTELGQVDSDDDLTADTPLIQSGLIDSLSLFRVIDFLEKTFGVQIRPEEIVLENFASIADMERFIEGKRISTGAS
jgi:acyl carrier protein